MSEKQKFEFREHTADICIVAYGETLGEAFENAALATFEAMTNTEKISPEHEEEVKVEGYDEKALLYNWIEALLVKFEITENLYSKFRIQSIQKTNTNYMLKATIQGEKFDPTKHLQKVGVKAVTYHQMEIKKTPNKTTVKFVLDI